MTDKYDALEAIDNAFPSSTSDADRVTQINTPVSVPISIPTSVWETYLSSKGFLLSIYAYSSSPPTGATIAAIEGGKLFQFWVTSPSAPFIDMTDTNGMAAEATAVLQVFVEEGTAGRLLSFSGNTFSQQNMDDLIVLATIQQSPAQQCGFNSITEDDLLAARDQNRGAN